MLTRHLAYLVLVTGSLCSAGSGVFAQDTDSKPHVPLAKAIGRVTPADPVPSLAVINSAGAKLEGGKLTLVGVSANSIVFADRPVRAAGHVATEQFIMQWDEGKDNFAEDPPNATVSVLGGDGSKVGDAVVTLKSPKLVSGNLTFDVTVLEGNLNGASGPAALFIDHFGGFGGGLGGFRGGFAGRFDGGIDRFGRADRFQGDRLGYARVGDVNVVRGSYWHAPVYRGAWYASPAAGAAVSTAPGAAEAATPYLGYGGQCGSYPYPPCY